MNEVLQVQHICFSNLNLGALYTVKPRFSEHQNSEKPLFSERFKADQISVLVLSNLQNSGIPYLVNKLPLTKPFTTALVESKVASESLVFGYLETANVEHNSTMLP